MKLKPFAIATALAAASWLVPNASRAETYQTDPAHSSVVFRVKHMNASYSWGRFNDIAGTFTLDAQDPSRSKLAFQVKAGSIDTGQAKRDQHLKSPTSSTPSSSRTSPS